jgi:hypothetical protein
MAETVGAVSGTRKNLSVSPPQPQAAARRRSSRGLSAEAQADSPTQAGIFWQKICGWQAPHSMLSLLLPELAKSRHFRASKPEYPRLSSEYPIRWFGETPHGSCERWG